MSFSKIRKSLLFLLLLFALPATMPCCAMDDDEFENLINDDQANEDFLVNNPNIRSSSTDMCSPQYLALSLVNFGIIPILQQNFYLRSNEFTQRSLLDF